MRTLVFKLLIVTLTFLSSVALARFETRLRDNPVIPATRKEPVVQVPAPVLVQTLDDETPADFYVDESPTLFREYRIERKVRKVNLEDGSVPRQVDVSFITVTRKGKLLRKFDANIYFGLGNSTDFAFFPFLGGDSPDLFVSQDVFRRGCQWIASLSPTFRVIFDGQEFSVGREGPDLTAIDLDRDGVYEVMAPITDFYVFSDKMSISQIPLPTIIFKYDVTKGKYLPANSLFEDYLLQQIAEFKGVDESDELAYRSVILERVLTYVYLGRREEAWEFYDRSYKLYDREEMERRVKSILFREPVYNFIYKRSKKNEHL